jgi:septum formation protein
MLDRSQLPLMQSLPRAEIPSGRRLILASGSPRRAQLLAAAGYKFTVELPADGAEDEPAAGETAAQVVQRLAYQKAADVAQRVSGGALVLAADTLADCDGRLLGKPADRDDAEQMIRRLSGRRHMVYTGICLWDTLTLWQRTDVVATELEMTPLGEATLAGHLDSLRWQGKAGAFGFQDDNDWLRIVDGGSPSNVVGLPMERLAELLQSFDRRAR